jgi:hypothetical protein
MADPSPQRRIGWPSFSLRTLLLGVTAVAISLAWWANSARQQRLGVAAIRQVYAADGRSEEVYICYDYELVEVAERRGFHYPFDEAGVEIDYNAVPTKGGWLRDRLGVDFFHSVIGVVLPELEDPDAALGPVARLGGLRHLVLEWGAAFDHGPSDAGISRLARLRALRSLDVRDCSALSDDSLRAIGQLRRLEVLKLWHGRFSDAGVRQLAQLRCLRLLLISNLLDDGGDLITDAGVAHLSRLTNLEQLYIASEQLTGKTLKSLAGMHKLDWLTLGSPLITDDDLRHLAPLESLDWMEFVGTGVNGTGFRHLREHPKLSSLSLGGTRLNDEGLAEIALLPRLEWVNVIDTHVTTAGLELLKKCPNLKTLIIGQNVPGDIKHLQQVLAPCRVEISGPHGSTMF